MRVQSEVNERKEKKNRGKKEKREKTEEQEKEFNGKKMKQLVEACLFVSKL